MRKGDAVASLRAGDPHDPRIALPLDVVCIGRSLGLHHILNSARAAVDGQSTLPASQAIAA